MTEYNTFKAFRIYYWMDYMMIYDLLTKMNLPFQVGSPHVTPTSFRQVHKHVYQSLAVECCKVILVDDERQNLQHCSKTALRYCSLVSMGDLQFQWVNPLFLSQFSMAMLNDQRVEWYYQWEISRILEWRYCTIENHILRGYPLIYRRRCLQFSFLKWPLMVLFQEAELQNCAREIKQ